MTRKSTSNITVAAFISKLVAASFKTQRQISEECGFENVNVISMIKNGLSKLPISRVGALAKALDTDPTYLLRLALSEYLPDTLEAIEQFMPQVVLTANERALVELFRIATKNENPQPVSLTMTADGTFSLVTEAM